METKVPQLEPAKEVKPLLGRPLWHLECSFFPLPHQSTEQGTQPGTERKLRYSFFLTFRAHADDIAGQIYISQRETGLAKPATLFPGNFVRNAHPLSFALQRTRNEAMFVDLDFRLCLRLVALDPELAARVRGAKAAVDCLFHDHTEELYFEQSGIFCGFMHAQFRPRGLAPGNVISYLLPAELARDVDLIRPQKCFEISPRSIRSLEGEGTVAVALLQQPRHPGIPERVTSLAVRIFRLSRRQLIAQSVRLLRLGRDIPAKLCRFLPPLARRVNVFDPPKPGTFARVERSHCRAV